MLVLPSNERLASLWPNASPHGCGRCASLLNLRRIGTSFFYTPCGPKISTRISTKNFHLLCLLLDASPHRHTEFSLDAANVSSHQNLRTHPGFSDPCSVGAVFLAGLFRRNSAGHCIGVHRITISDTRATGPMASVCGKAVRPTDHAGGFAQGPLFIYFRVNIGVLP